MLNLKCHPEFDSENVILNLIQNQLDPDFRQNNAFNNLFNNFVIYHSCFVSLYFAYSYRGKIKSWALISLPLTLIFLNQPQTLAIVIPIRKPVKEPGPVLISIPLISSIV